MKTSPVLMLAVLLTVGIVGYMIVDSKKREPAAPTPAPETSAPAPAPAGAASAPAEVTPPTPSPAPEAANNDASAQKELIKQAMRNVITAEEAYYANAAKYSNDPAELQVPIPPQVKLQFLSVGIAGYGIRGTNDKLPGLECGWFVGNAPPVRPAKVMAQLQCSDEQP